MRKKGKMLCHSRNTAVLALKQVQYTEWKFSGLKTSEDDGFKSHVKKVKVPLSQSALRQEDPSYPVNGIVFLRSNFSIS